MARSRLSTAFAGVRLRSGRRTVPEDLAAGSPEGTHAVPSLLMGASATFGECRVRRMIIWGSGLTGGLPAIRGGWSWVVASVADAHPDAPLKELQTRMRQQEGLLAEDLCAAGDLTIVDGPLNFVRSRDLPVVGYVKTHHRALLDPEHHKLIPTLRAGQRSSALPAWRRPVLGVSAPDGGGCHLQSLVRYCPDRGSSVSWACRDDLDHRPHLRVDPALCRYPAPGSAGAAEPSAHRRAGAASAPPAWLSGTCHSRRAGSRGQLCRGAAVSVTPASGERLPSGR